MHQLLCIDLKKLHLSQLIRIMFWREVKLQNTSHYLWSGNLWRKRHQLNEGSPVQLAILKLSSTFNYAACWIDVNIFEAVRSFGYITLCRMFLTLCLDNKGLKNYVFHDQAVIWFYWVKPGRIGYFRDLRWCPTILEIVNPKTTIYLKIWWRKSHNFVLAL